MKDQPAPRPALASTYLSAHDVVALGVLQEVNRRLLHPLGLALSLGQTQHDGRAVLTVWDQRALPCGIVFSSVPQGAVLARASAFETLWAQRTPRRKRRLGFVEQPLQSCSTEYESPTLTYPVPTPREALRGAAAPKEGDAPDVT